jgi:hypothetical protein
MRTRNDHPSCVALVKFPAGWRIVTCQNHVAPTTPQPMPNETVERLGNLGDLQKTGSGGNQMWRSWLELKPASRPPMTDSDGR